MMARITRVTLLAASLLLLLCGLLFERHSIMSLSGGEAKTVDGPGFVEIASYDGVMLKDGALHDIYSLWATRPPVRDCPT